MAKNLMIRASILLGLGFAIMMILRVGLLAMANPAGATLPIKFRPDDSVQVLARAGYMTVDLLKTKLDPDNMRGAAQAANAIDPLDHRPFLLMGTMLSQQNDHIASTKFLEVARHLQPRTFETRLMLMQQYLLAGRADASIQEILSSTNLASKDNAQLMRVISLMSQDNALRSDILAVLIAKPDWRKRFLDTAILNGEADDLVTALAQSTKTSPAEKQNIVNILVQHGKVPLAYQVSQSIRGNAVKAAIPNDSGFDGIGKGQAFGWNLEASTSISADFVPDEHGKGQVLDIAYYGGGGALNFGKQVLVLSPGHYHWTLTGNNKDAKDNAGEYRWAVTCADMKTPVSTIILSSNITGQFTKAADFVIPAQGCASQEIGISILPGELDRGMQMQFEQLHIVTGGGK